MKKTAAFYLLILAGILAAVGLYFYQSAAVQVDMVKYLTYAVIGVTALMAVLALATKKAPVLNLCATVLAVLTAWTLVTSADAQLDPLGWWVAGLYSYEQVRGYIFYAVLLGVALLLQLISSFINLKKEA